MSLKVKLTLFIILFAFFPIALLEGYQSVSRYKTQIADSENRMLRDAHTQKDAFIRFFEGVCQKVAFIGRVTEVGKLLAGFEDKDLDEITYWADSLAMVLISFADNFQVFTDLVFNITSEKESIIWVKYTDGQASRIEGADLPGGFKSSSMKHPSAVWDRSDEGVNLWLHYPVRKGESIGTMSAKINLKRFYILCKDKEIYLTADQGFSLISAGQPGNNEAVFTHADITEAHLFSSVRFAPVNWMPDDFFTIFKIRPRSVVIGPIREEFLNQGAGFFFVLLGLMLCQILLLNNLILRPLHTVSDSVYRLADFDLTVTVDTKRKDEIGMLLTAIGTMVLELREMVRDVKSGGKRLAEASAQMNGNIRTIASAAEEISINIQSVSHGAARMLQNNSSVASAVEKMSASINEVGKNARQGSLIAGDAVAMAGKAGRAMNSLGEAANGIGEITEVIKGIADKTSLLALNADIEAASAGEAGRGFSVVANEIRDFACQSTLAADNIASRISGIQENTEQAVGVIHEISGIIDKIDTSSKTISFALEEQMNATNEIAINAAQASARANNIAASTDHLARGISEVSMSVGMAVGETGGDDDAFHINASAAEVARLAKALLDLVDKFDVE